ncbi:MAG: PIN domain-containing protein [Anaerolineae bacterium]|nr:PIN domain-containing protein [Anaerolineae bacterium]
MADANILVAGTGWPRFPYEVLQHAVRRDFVLVLAPIIIEEARRHILRLIPEAIGRFEEILQAANCEIVGDPAREEVASHATLVRDPKDVPVALAALNAKVDLLITQDRDFTDEAESTQELHRRLTIVLPGTFLREYMGWTSEELEALRNRTWQDLAE